MTQFEWTFQRVSPFAVVVSRADTNEPVARVILSPVDPDQDVLRLVATAPKLLQACKEMIQAYWRGSEDSPDEEAPDMVKLALEAIFEATGERI